MPIILNGQVASVDSLTAKPEPVQEPVAVASPPPRVEVARVRVEPPKLDEEEELRRRLSMNRILKGRKVPPGASEESALVVNGKVKSIGRKSHYLLDMLTIEDE